MDGPQTPWLVFHRPLCVTHLHIYNTHTHKRMCWPSEDLLSPATEMDFPPADHTDLIHIAIDLDVEMN